MARSGFGRLVVLDVVCETEPDPAIRSDEILRGECIAGAQGVSIAFGLILQSTPMKAAARQQK